MGWVVNVTPRPRFTPGKGLLVPIGQEAGWASELVWTQRLEEIYFAASGDRTLVVQPVVKHYTDWATPVNDLGKLKEKCVAMVSLDEKCSSIWRNCELSKWYVNSDVIKNAELRHLKHIGMIQRSIIWVLLNL
jgi:hypothetical protein